MSSCCCHGAVESIVLCRCHCHGADDMHTGLVCTGKNKVAGIHITYDHLLSDIVIHAEEYLCFRRPQTLLLSPLIQALQRRPALRSSRPLR